MWRKEIDGSIVDENGKVIYFSTERFVNDICLGNCCFICGAKPDEKPFNDEHVLPEWVLRKYNLFARRITLSNGVQYRYDRFTVPCCADCNSLMGRVIEDPISEVVKGGAAAISDFNEKHGLLKFYVWMGLIFLKAHLKDREFRWHLDAREGQEKIADLHTWEELHHLHCVVRCFYTQCTVEQKAAGSFLGISVRQDCSPEEFDFAELSSAQTMVVRFGDAAMFAVFNDSGAAMTKFWEKLERITGAVSEIQLREILIELAFLNLHVKNRASFHSEINLDTESYRILAKRPLAAEFNEFDYAVRGSLLHHSIEHVLSKIRVPNRTQDEISDAIKTGRFSFLFDNDGRFIEKTVVAAEG